MVATPTAREPACSARAHDCTAHSLTECLMRRAQATVSAVLTHCPLLVAEVLRRRAARQKGSSMIPITEDALKEALPSELFENVPAGRVKALIKAVMASKAKGLVGTVLVVRAIAQLRADGEWVDEVVAAAALRAHAQDGGRAHRCTLHRALDSPAAAATAAATAAAATAAATPAQALDSELMITASAPCTTGRPPAQRGGSGRFMPAEVPRVTFSRADARRFRQLERTLQEWQVTTGRATTSLLEFTSRSRPGRDFLDRTKRAAKAHMTRNYKRALNQRTLDVAVLDWADGGGSFAAYQRRRLGVMELNGERRARALKPSKWTFEYVVDRYPGADGRLENELKHTWGRQWRRELGSLSDFRYPERVDATGRPHALAGLPVEGRLRHFGLQDAGGGSVGGPKLFRAETRTKQHGKHVTKIVTLPALASTVDPIFLLHEGGGGDWSHRGSFVKQLLIRIGFTDDTESAPSERRRLDRVCGEAMALPGVTKHVLMAEIRRAFAERKRTDKGTTSHLSTVTSRLIPFKTKDKHRRTVFQGIKTVRSTARTMAHVSIFERTLAKWNSLAPFVRMGCSTRELQALSDDELRRQVRPFYCRDIITPLADLHRAALLDVAQSVFLDDDRSDYNDAATIRCASVQLLAIFRRYRDAHFRDDLSEKERRHVESVVRCPDIVAILEVTDTSADIRACCRLLVQGQRNLETKNAGVVTIELKSGQSFERRPKVATVLADGPASCAPLGINRVGQFKDASTPHLPSSERRVGRILLEPQATAATIAAVAERVRQARDGGSFGGLDAMSADEVREIAAELGITSSADLGVLSAKVLRRKIKEIVGGVNAMPVYEGTVESMKEALHSLHMAFKIALARLRCDGVLSAPEAALLDARCSGEVVHLLDKGNVTQRDFRHALALYAELFEGFPTEIQDHFASLAAMLHAHSSPGRERAARGRVNILSYAANMLNWAASRSSIFDGKTYKGCGEGRWIGTIYRGSVRQLLNLLVRPGPEADAGNGESKFHQMNAFTRACGGGDVAQDSERFLQYEQLKHHADRVRRSDKLQKADSKLMKAYRMSCPVDKRVIIKNAVVDTADFLVTTCFTLTMFWESETPYAHTLENGDVEIHCGEEDLGNLGAALFNDSRLGGFQLAEVLPLLQERGAAHLLAGKIPWGYEGGRHGGVQGAIAKLQAFFNTALPTSLRRNTVATEADDDDEDEDEDEEMLDEEGEGEGEYSEGEGDWLRIASPSTDGLRFDDDDEEEEEEEDTAMGGVDQADLADYVRAVHGPEEEEEEEEGAPPVSTATTLKQLFAGNIEGLAMADAYAVAVERLAASNSDADQATLLQVKAELRPLLAATGIAATERLAELARSGESDGVDSEAARVEDAIVNSLTSRLWPGEEDGGAPGSIAISTELRPGQLAAEMARAHGGRPQRRRVVLEVTDEERLVAQEQAREAEVQAVELEQEAAGLEQDAAAEAGRKRREAGKRRREGKRGPPRPLAAAAAAPRLTTRQRAMQTAAAAALRLQQR